MGGRTFRSRWVVRWAAAFGGVSIAVAIILFLAAYQKSQTHDAAAEEAAARSAKACEEQIANGTGGVDSPCEDRLGASANVSAKGFLSGTVLLVVGLTQLVGAARVGVTLTGSGLIIRNPLRTYRLRWSELKGFRTEVGQRGPMSYAFGRVDLLNGDTHRIEAICAMPWEDKTTFLDKRVIDALNAELEAHRNDPVDEHDDGDVIDVDGNDGDDVVAAQDVAAFTASPPQPLFEPAAAPRPQAPVERVEPAPRVEPTIVVPAEPPAAAREPMPVAPTPTPTPTPTPVPAAVIASAPAFAEPERPVVDEPAPDPYDDMLIGDPEDMLIGDPLDNVKSAPR